MRPVFSIPLSGLHAVPQPQPSLCVTPGPEFSSINCSASLALVKLQLLPFHVKRRVAGYANLHLMLWHCRAFLAAVNVFLFRTSSLDTSGNTDSLRFSYNIPRFSLAKASTFFLAEYRRNLISTGLGSWSMPGLGAAIPCALSTQTPHPHRCRAPHIKLSSHTRLHGAICSIHLLQSHESHITVL